VFYVTTDRGLRGGGQGVSWPPIFEMGSMNVVRTTRFYAYIKFSVPFVNYALMKRITSSLFHSRLKIYTSLTNPLLLYSLDCLRDNGSGLIMLISLYLVSSFTLFVHAV